MEVNRDAADVEGYMHESGQTLYSMYSGWTKRANVYTPRGAYNLLQQLKELEPELLALLAREKPAEME